MTSKFFIFPVIILIMVIVAGCGGGGGGVNPPNYSEIVKLLNNFESAVEAYQVSGPNGMLDCLSGADFKLTIQEAGLSYKKTYDDLKKELEDDETNQTTWRKPASEGNGYILDLVLGTPSYSNETPTGAIVRQTFVVLESAASPVIIDQMPTDNGVITWEVAQINGAWKAVAMTIEYQALSGSGLKVAGTGSKSSGFGFTTLF